MYMYIFIYIYIHIYVCACISMYVYMLYLRIERLLHATALVCLSNREIVDASRGCTYHCKMADNLFFF